MNGVILTSTTPRNKMAFFSKAGFFEATEVVFSRTGWSFDCGGRALTYSIDDYLGAVIVGHYSMVAVKGGKKRAHVVVVDESDERTLGVLCGIRRVMPWMVLPKWLATEVVTPDNLPLVVDDGLRELKKRGPLLEIDPWLTYRGEAVSPKAP